MDYESGMDIFQAWLSLAIIIGLLILAIITFRIIDGLFGRYIKKASIPIQNGFWKLPVIVRRIFVITFVVGFYGAILFLILKYP